MDVRNSGHATRQNQSTRSSGRLETSTSEDRGAEQGNVDFPLECSPALGMVAAEAWMCVTMLHGNDTLEVAVGHGGVSQTSSWQKQMSSGPCMNACSCVRTRRQDFPSSEESLGVSRINHILRVHGRTILHERKAATIFDEVGQRSLERLFPGFAEDSSEHATLSASQSGIGYRRARDVARPAHLGAPLDSQNADSRHDSRRSNSWQQQLASCQNNLS